MDNFSMQNVKDLEIPEGDVRTIHDSNGKQLWGKVAYDTKYAGDATQASYTGKNIFKAVSRAETSGILTTVNTDNSVTVSGKATASGVSLTASFYLPTTLEAGTTFTLSFKNPAPCTIRVFCGGVWATVTAGNTSATSASTTTSGGYLYMGAIMTNGTEYNFNLDDIQVEVGSTATSFEPYVGGTPAPSPDYPQAINVVKGSQTITLTDGVVSDDFTVNLGSIELAKIGTYQDYIYKSSGNWYVHKATQTIASYNGETVTTEYMSTTGQLTTGATVYYALATPTDTLVTDSTLISQLEAIHSWLTRYGYQYSVVGSLPIIILQTNL